MVLLGGSFLYICFYKTLTIFHMSSLYTCCSYMKLICMYVNTIVINVICTMNEDKRYGLAVRPVMKWFLRINKSFAP